MRIGKAAEASGTSARALRYYEDEGLIRPGRHENGYRDYCSSTITTVVQVRELLDAGLPVRLIRKMLPHLDDAPAAAPTCGEILAELEDHRSRLAARIADLTARHDAVESYLRQARAALGRPRT